MADSLFLPDLSLCPARKCRFCNVFCRTPQLDIPAGCLYNRIVGKWAWRGEGAGPAVFQIYPAWVFHSLPLWGACPSPYGTEFLERMYAPFPWAALFGYSTRFAGFLSHGEAVPATGVSVCRNRKSRPSMAHRLFCIAGKDRRPAVSPSNKPEQSNKTRKEKTGICRFIGSF